MFDGKAFRCEAEVGSVKSGWRLCNGRAVIQARSGRCDWLWLDFCAAHVDRATSEDRRLIDGRARLESLLAAAKAALYAIPHPDTRRHVLELERMLRAYDEEAA